MIHISITRPEPAFKALVDAQTFERLKSNDIWTLSMRARGLNRRFIPSKAFALSETVLFPAECPKAAVFFCPSKLRSIRKDIRMTYLIKHDDGIYFELHFV